MAAKILTPNKKKKKKSAKSKRPSSGLHPGSKAQDALSKMHPVDRDRAMYHSDAKGSLMSSMIMKGVKSVAGRKGAHTKKKGGRIHYTDH